jgi:DNA replication protein DnaC
VSSVTCSCCRMPLDECLVRREIRLLATPEGRVQLRDEYFALLRARQNAPAAEEWHRAAKAGVPADALATLRSNPKDTEALSAARRFCSPAGSFALFLLLLGRPGAGKTVAAAHVVLEFCRRWAWNEQPTGTTFEPVMWVEAARLTRMSAFDANDKAYVEQLTSTRLLVLDDAGDEGTELGKGVLVELLMARDARRRRTVLCSNLPAEEFKARYGEAVSDRVRKSGIVPNLAKAQSLRKRVTP